MRRRRSAPLPGLLLGLGLLGLAPALGAQTASDEPSRPAADLGAPERGATAPKGIPSRSVADIDELLYQEMEALAGTGATYDPGDRRDPFRSLVRVNTRLERGPRPEGIPGLLIDEVELTGIFVTAEGPVAQVRPSDQKKSYLLRVGDQLYDGDVVEITLEGVTFKQMVNDPTAIKPFRDVVKKLHP